MARIRKRPILGADSALPQSLKGKDHPLDSDRAIQRFFHLVVEHVLYSQFVDLEPPLSVDRFLQLRTLSILDRYYQVDDETILMKMGVAAEHLAMLRAHPHYAPIMEVVKDRVSTLSKPRSMDEWARDSQDRMANEMFLAAVSEGSLRDRVPAMETFLDRVSAKKGREAEDRPAMMFPDDALKIMQFALQAASMKQVGAGSTGDIAGDVLNVPAAPKRMLGSPNEPPVEG